MARTYIIGPTSYDPDKNREEVWRLIRETIESIQAENGRVMLCHRMMTLLGEFSPDKTDDCGTSLWEYAQAVAKDGVIVLVNEPNDEGAPFAQMPISGTPGFRLTRARAVIAMIVEVLHRRGLDYRTDVH